MHDCITVKSNIYSTIRENGVVDIGLAAALDKGVREADFIQIPQSCLKPITTSGGTTLRIIGNAASGKRIGHMKPLYVGADRFQYNDHKIDSARQDKLTDDDLMFLVVANFRACKEAELEADDLGLVVAAHVMAVVMGAVEMGGGGSCHRGRSQP